MRPKGKLFALLAVFAAIGLVTASGAFTTVSAERTATVNVAGDSSALLQLQGNSTYATTDGGQNGGELTLNFDTDAGASGLNQNATTEVNHVFNITNQGSQNVIIDIGVQNDSDADSFAFFDGNDDSSINGTELGPGDSVSVGMEIITDGDGNDFNVDFTIVADAEETA
ncbi:hypothetical protein [Halorarum halobium]|uniref:hypothetical protein n=1 Tax=Halorarum halobium TaxID=3075121 RepID=UPI0028AEC18D|nr:hypothetical protein [Halobaculum sp. XH14]